VIKIVTALITAAFSAIANVFGWSKQRSEQKNREDVVKGKVAKDENAQQDATAKAVANEDVERIRKELSE
jgi:hypothetical protein